MKNLRLLFVLIIFVLPALIAGIRPDIFKILISPLKQFINFIIYSETMGKIEDNFVYFGILIIIFLLILLVVNKFRS